MSGKAQVGPAIIKLFGLAFRGLTFVVRVDKQSSIDTGGAFQGIDKPSSMSFVEILGRCILGLEGPSRGGFGAW